MKQKERLGFARLRNSVRLDLKVQARYSFPQIYAYVTAVYVVLFLATGLHRTFPPLLPLFLLSEPGMLGYTFAAAQVHFERGQGSAVALAVTPLRTGEYVLGKCIASAITAASAGLLLYALVVGMDTRLLWLLPPLALTAAAFGLLGMGLSAGYDDFARFLFTTMPPVQVILVALPALLLLGMVPGSWFAWTPSYQALSAFALLAGGRPDPFRYLFQVGYLGLSVVVVYRWAVGRFEAARETWG
ncbi:MAG: hypothetical protein Q8P31_01695 [Bacillota bacterium]|nr:hypothetical protein [Bacillota bacterium]